MKLTNLVLSSAAIGFLSLILPSCLNDNDSIDLQRPTALVTVCPNDDGTFIMQLDNSTQLVPTNVTASPFGTKEVRALVNYTEAAESTENDNIRNVQVNWIDSIRTKLPVVIAGDDNVAEYGEDPIEIVPDWVTIAEDGYLTLRIRTVWESPDTPHYVNLLSGTNPSDPYEFELRHNAQGNMNGKWGDALIAFNLNKLSIMDSSEKKIRLKWKSFTGEKTAEFEIKMRPKNK